MMCKFDLVIDIILLHYYSINTLLKVFNFFYSRRRITTSFWYERDLQMFCRDRE